MLKIRSTGQRKTFTWHTFILPASLTLLIFLLTACGGAGTSNSATQTSASQQYARHAASSSGSSFSNDNTNGGVGKPATDNKTGAQADSSISQPYLIKTLKVSLAVKDSRQSANDLQAWIAKTDPQSTSAGADYEQTGDNLYNITLTFSVTKDHYPDISSYLSNYPSQKGGHLLSFNETVQDVTNDYVDSSSRLSNLQAEQKRVQDIMAHATALSDVLQTEQKLTDIEGQIESIEAHLKQLDSQTQYYTVTITLQPISTVPPPPPDNNGGWNFGQTLHDALGASLIFGEGLISFLVWLLAFAIYLVPVLLIVFLIIRVRNRTHQRTAVPRADSFRQAPGTIPTPSTNAPVADEDEETTPTHA